MLSIINNNQDLTMSSVDLLSQINKFREGEGLLRTRNNDFLSRVEDEIEDLPPYETFVKLGINVKGYRLNQKQILLIGMRESKVVRRKVLEWIETLTKPKEDPIVLLAQKVLQQDAEIKHLEKTKAHINDKRTATVMGKLGAATKKIKTLESKFQDVGTRLSLKGAKLPERIDTEFKADVQTWRVLKQLSLDMNQSIEKVEDSNYGSVNTYHIDVIEAFKSEYL